MTNDRPLDPRSGPELEPEEPTETLGPSPDRQEAELGGAATPTAEAPCGGSATPADAGTPSGEAPSGGSLEPPLARGAEVGRFVVLGVEGAGGMGWVFAAWDPKLDRKVALKLLRPRGGGERPDATRRRLLREAQALARLSHPNVIAVYDAGEVGGRVFLAMEYVAGETLGAWLAACTPPRGRRAVAEVLRAFLQAGRGLAAAHAAGLVHRDFKPANAMVAADGRVLVLDFGLARPEAGGDGDVVALEELERPAAALARASQTVGARAGTPAYMAPEQRAGDGRRPVTAAADQYGFCAALWEALYGELPPASGTATGSGSSTGSSRARRAAPERSRRGAGARVPPRIRRALRRGLALEPSDRHPSMDALLAELEGGLAPARRRWLAAAVVGALLAGGALGYQRAADRRAELCRVPEARLAAVWGGERRAAAERAFEATGLAYAADAYAAADRGLSGYLEAWGAMYEDSCAATRLRGEQSEHLLDLRTACLNERVAEADALARLLAEADAELVARAAEAAGDLGPLAACADTAALTAPLAPPADEEARAEVAAVRGRLAEAAALFRVGRFDESLVIADAEEATARAIGYWPLIAEALLRRARVLERQVDPGTREALESALLAAEAGRHDQVAVEGFVRLVRFTSEREADHENALGYAAHAEALLGQLGDRRDLEAQLADFVGEVYRRRGEPSRALEQYRRTLTLLEAEHGREHIAVATTLGRIGLVQAELGDLAAARASDEEALALYRRLLGADHPEVAPLHDNLGTVLQSLGDYEAAAGHHRRALGIARAAYGDRHPLVATTLTNLGNVYLRGGDYDRALARYREAQAAFEATLGTDHPNVALALSNVGSAEVYLGDHAAAAESYRRALAIREAALGPDHPAVANTVFNLGEAQRATGNVIAAAESYRRALAIWQSALGSDHFLVAYGLTGLGEALLSLGEPARALTPLRQALKLREGTAGDPALLAETRFALARALAASGRGTDEAYRLAAAARDGYARVGATGERELAEVEAWLSAHAAWAAGPPALASGRDTPEKGT